MRPAERATLQPGRERVWRLDRGGLTDELRPERRPESAEETLVAKSYNFV